MRSTPIIIPAYNEADKIGHLVGLLRASLGEKVRLIVADGDSDDETAAIARRAGAEVVATSGPAGKLPGLQAALRLLGDEALQPFVLLDADTFPQDPPRWLECLLSPLERARAPMLISSLAWFEDARGRRVWLPSVALILGCLWPRMWSRYDSPFLGPSQAFVLRRREVLRAVLALPAIWPGDDIILARTVANRGTGGRMKVSLSARGFVTTDYNKGHNFSLLDYLKAPFRRRWQEKFNQKYEVSGVVSWTEYLRQHPNLKW